MKKRNTTYSAKDLEPPKPTLLERLLRPLPTPPPTKKEAARVLKEYLEHDHFHILPEPTKIN